MKGADPHRATREFFDSNVVVYALAEADGPEEARKRESARQTIVEAASRKKAVISAQVLGESFITLIRKGAAPMKPEVAAKHLRGFADLRVVPLTGELVFRAIELQGEHQLSYWDALIVAAAESACCETLWSEDLSDGRSYGSVTVRNPFRVRA